VIDGRREVSGGGSLSFSFRRLGGEGGHTDIPSVRQAPVNKTGGHLGVNRGRKMEREGSLHPCERKPIQGRACITTPVAT